MTTNLKIKQSIDTTEVVDWEVIDKLYHLVTSSNGAEPEVTAASGDITGNLSTDHAFEDAVVYLRQRFPGLLINVVDNNYYIRFADANVEAALMNSGLGDGNGITISEATAARFADLFKNNTDIRDFNEFSYFTSQNQSNSFSFEGCTKLRSIDLSNLTTPPPANAFKDCTALANYGDEDGVLNLSKLGAGTIGNYAFQNNTGITEISSLGNCTEIGEYAFQNCINLTTIDQSILNNITYLGNYCFKGCSQLSIEDLSLPNIVSLSTWGAFNGCTGLKNSLKTISNLGNITRTGIGEFENCKLLTSVILPETCTRLDQSTFQRCTSLISINTDNIKTFDYACLGNCTSLEIINITEGSYLSRISNFAGCINLKYYHGSNSEEGVLDLSKTINTSSDSDFFNNKCLKTISSLGSITQLNGTFGECNNLEYINETDFQNIISLNSSAFKMCSKLTNLINLNLPNLKILGENVFRECIQIETVENLGNITSIGNNCFYGCTSLTSINLPDSLTSIGSGCFSGCSKLQGTFNIPEGVTVIGAQIVFNCSLLSEIILPSTAETINGWAFQGCSSLTSITCKAITPPTGADTYYQWFGGTNNCPVYVPSESVEAYKVAPGWSDVASRIQAIPTE